MVLQYFSALDRIVQEAFSALQSVSSYNPANSPVVAGGMAIQLHCLREKELLRPTSDLDVAYLPHLSSYNHFRESIGGQLSDKLVGAGYQVQLKKGKGKFEVKMMNGQGRKAKELFFIHFGNLPASLRDRQEAVFRREAENTVNLSWNDPELWLYVLRIEDIIPRKLNRLRKNISRLREVTGRLLVSLYEEAERGDWKALAGVPLNQWNEEIIRVQNQYTYPHFPESYVINKDLYDLCLLARKIEGTPSSFNKAYYLATKGEVDGLSQR